MTDIDKMLKVAGLYGDDGNRATPDGFKSGFVTLVGRPNVGKSTLVNAIMGRKVAITSNTAQTTRHRFRAIYNTDDMQMVLVDTPGLHKPNDALGSALNESALQALADIDVAAFLIASDMPVGRGDAWVAERVGKLDCKKILVISKMDLVDGELASKQRKAAEALMRFDDVIELSARTGVGIPAFVDSVKSMLPEGPRWFPEDLSVDQPDEVIVAEFIREKVLRHTKDEVPHAVGVAVESIEHDCAYGLVRIWAVIYVERESQKGILIGHKGSKIKQVGSEARIDLERFFGARVYLDLTCKVKRKWRDDLNQIRRFGYAQGV